MTTPTTTKFISVNEASRRLGIRLDSTYRLLQLGLIPATKNDYGVWLIREEAVDARIAARRQRRRSVRSTSNTLARETAITA